MTAGPAQPTALSKTQEIEQMISQIQTYIQKINNFQSKKEKPQLKKHEDEFRKLQKELKSFLSPSKIQQIANSIMAWMISDEKNQEPKELYEKVNRLKSNLENQFKDVLQENQTSLPIAGNAQSPERINNLLLASPTTQEHQPAALVNNSIVPNNQQSQPKSQQQKKSNQPPLKVTDVSVPPSLTETQKIENMLANCPQPQTGVSVVRIGDNSVTSKPSEQPKSQNKTSSDNVVKDFLNKVGLLSPKTQNQPSQQQKVPSKVAVPVF